MCTARRSRTLLQITNDLVKNAEYFKRIYCRLRTIFPTVLVVHTNLTLFLVINHQFFFHALPISTVIRFMLQNIFFMEIIYHSQSFFIIRNSIVIFIHVDFFFSRKMQMLISNVFKFRSGFVWIHEWINFALFHLR